MLTVLLTTARAPRCYTHYPDWDQFDVLARQLNEQIYRDFELVVVTPFVEHAHGVLDRHIPRLTVVPPRDTPWRRERMFAVCSARNTGLTHARGDWVLIIDDCSEFGPDFLARVADWAAKNIGVAVMYRKPDGTVHDGRWPMFCRLAGSADSITLRGADPPTPYGYISFPIARAVAVNGYAELRFDGARGLEDMDFARRLMLHGLVLAMDRNIVVALHDHLGYPGDIIDNESQNGRCCNTAYSLPRELTANKRRCTQQEKNGILHCKFWRGDGQCGYHNFRSACAYPQWAKNGHPVARRILLNDEEELFDLAEARRQVESK